MRVLIVSRGVRPITSDLAGGAEHVLLNHARGLAALGHEVHLVSDCDKALIDNPSIVVHPVGVPRRLGAYLRRSGFYLWIVLHLLGNLLAFWRGYQVLRSSQKPFDVVHCHGNLSGFLFTLFCESTPIVYTEHDSTPWACQYPSLLERAVRKLVYRALNVPLFRRADKTVVLYADQKEELQRRWGIPAERLFVAPNGIDDIFLAPATSNGTAANGNASLPAKGYCMFVGRLEPRKGVESLLHALADSSIPCLIVGDGPDRKRLMDLSSRLNLTSRVVFTGAVNRSDLTDYYRHASFLVLPSLSEAFPLTALEAMASGIPVLASRVGVLPDLIEPHQCGLVFTPGQAAELSQRIQTLASDPEMARRMGHNGRETVLRKFTWNAVILELVRLYQGLSRPQAGGNGTAPGAGA